MQALKSGTEVDVFLLLLDDFESELVLDVLNLVFILPDNPIELDFLYQVTGADLRLDLVCLLLDFAILDGLIIEL